MKLRHKEVCHAEEVHRAIVRLTDLERSELLTVIKKLKGGHQDRREAVGCAADDEVTPGSLARLAEVSIVTD